MPTGRIDRMTESERFSLQEARDPKITHHDVRGLRRPRKSTVYGCYFFGGGSIETLPISDKMVRTSCKDCPDPQSRLHEKKWKFFGSSKLGHVSQHNSGQRRPLPPYSGLLG